MPSDGIRYTPWMQMTTKSDAAPELALRGYAGAVAAVAFAALVRWLLDPVLGRQVPFALFLMVVALVTAWWGRGPALLALGLGSLCATLFLTWFRAPDPATVTSCRAPMSAAVYVLLGVVVIWACERGRAIHQRLGQSDRDKARLEATSGHLAAIVASSGDAIVSKDLSGRILSWNAGAERLFGYTAEEAVGRQIEMLIPADHRDEEPDILARIRRGEIIDHYETVRLRKDGGLIEISLTVSPIHDATGRIVGASKIARDISAAKADKIALNRSEQQARAALATAENAGRSKDEFLALLSHELRTPMSAILGWTRLLRAGMSPDEMAHGLEVIERNSRLQAQIIEDLLDMSRIVSGKFRLDVQTVNVGALVRLAVDSVRVAVEAKDLRLSVVSDPLPHEIRGDPSRLQQVFFNLLANAAKFTPRGGSIQVACQRAGSSVEVTVSDTGRGISPEFLPHVFERFQQQDGKSTRAHQGLGLGLAIVKHLVELHGGTVLADSAGEGKGATFTVHLPISVALTPQPSSAWPARRDHPSAENWMTPVDTRPVDASALAGVTVMVTDDEADAREMLRRMLEGRGAKVLVCGSAADTMDRLQRHRPNVLVCDIGMPGTDGYALISS